MKIISTKIFKGRSIYSHKPVIEMLVELEELSEKSTVDFKDFNTRLVELMPTLVEHHCGIGKHGGFIERMEEGTYFVHVTEHIALELQALLGYEVYFGKTRLKEDPSLYSMIIEYKNEQVAISCVKEAINIVESIINDEYLNLEDILCLLNEVKERFELGPSTKAIYDEAKSRGIPVRRLGGDSILELGYGKHRRLVQAALTDNTRAIAIDISCNKQLTKQLLMENNIPVSYGDTTNNLNEALEIAWDIGYPVVLKPLDGNQGKGVVLNISSEEELIESFEIPMRYSDNVLVEKYVSGKDYRVLVIDGKVSAVAERRAPKVIGDGVHTIRELVNIENESELRGYGHEKPQTKIRLDNVALNYLYKNNLTDSSIPEKDRIIRLRENKNISTGGSAIECTKDIHPDNVKISIDAANAIGLDIAGIDIMTKDISKSIFEDGGAVIEVNAVPGLRMHLYPTVGNSKNVAADILDSLYPKDALHSIPIVAITGTNGKTTTTRLINHCISLAEDKVGMTSSSGIYIDNKCILEGDNTGPLSARNVLSSKDIDIALLEVARGGLVKRGLGYDLADVAVVTNIGDDHIGLDGIEDKEDLAFAKSLVIEAVKSSGYSVLNADDEMIEYLMERASGNKILFSRNPENEIIKKHIDAGNIALCIEEDSIYIYDEGKNTRLIDIDKVPITFNGILDCNIENVLAASSTLYGLGKPLAMIRNGLMTFKSDEVMNPGRFNMFDIGSIKVMMDYGHNIDGYEEVGKFISQRNDKRNIGIIGSPGDRTNEQIFNIGAKSAEIFSKVYIKEDTSPRGRNTGEVANILREGLISKGFLPEEIEIIHSETEALRSAVMDSREGDFITYFYEDFDESLDVINELREEILNRNNIVLSSLA